MSASKTAPTTTGTQVSESEQLLDLANEIEAARKAYLDAFAGPDAEDRKLRLQDILWNDKGTIEYAVRIASRAAPPRCDAVTEERSDSWVLDTARELSNVLCAKYSDKGTWRRNVPAMEIVKAIDGFLYVRPSALASPPPVGAREALEPFRNADDKDWAHLDQFIPQSGHGQFWRAVFAEVRAALSKQGDAVTEPAIGAMYDALLAANIEFSAWSCNGINLVGDSKSIKAASAAFHSHGQIDDLKTQIRHWREECGKLHAKLSKQGDGK